MPRTSASFATRLRRQVARILALGLVGMAAIAGGAEAPDVMRDATGSLGQTQRCRPGPWGQVEFTTTLVEPPARLFGPTALASRPPVWPFPGHSEDQLARALEQAGLPAPTVRDLLAGAEHSNETIVARPSEALLLGLDARTRYRVYALLRDSSNPAYRYPIHINRRYAHTWLEGAAHQPDVQQCLQQLMYHQGDMAYFSDHRFLMSKLPGLAERRQLTMALLRQASVTARLTVTNHDEARRCAAYWGRGGREADVQRLLEDAVGREPVELHQLLPPIPRARLNTYQADDYHQFLDCTWTALNFFNEVGDDRFLQPEVANRTLLENYVSIPDGYQLGDLILLRNRSGRILHSCNYLADHLVFTKNGGDLAQPWIISTLREVANYYTIDGEPPEYLFLRARTPQSPIVPAQTALR